jgi:hypothetical protein
MARREADEITLYLRPGDGTRPGDRARLLDIAARLEADGYDVRGARKDVSIAATVRALMDYFEAAGAHGKK